MWKFLLKTNTPNSYAATFSKPKPDPMKINLGSCDLRPPWHPETSDAQRRHHPNRYSGSFRRYRKRFRVKLTFALMDQQFPPGGFRAKRCDPGSR
ncbi:hypothetical protein ACTXT7_010342 [Hymenolepis weldensis]